MIKRTWQKMILGDMSPAAIALGIALGTFAALLPTFGFSIILAFGLAALFPKINKPAVFIALLFWNPLVQIPIYALSFEIGSLLFANAPVVHYNFELLNHLYSFTRRVLIGQMIVATALTVLAYTLAYLITLFAPHAKSWVRTLADLPSPLRFFQTAKQ